MREMNCKVSDDSVYIKGHKIQIVWGSAPTLDLFSSIYGIVGDDIFTVQGNFWSNYILSNNSRGGGDIKDCVKKAIRNIQHTNTDVHIRSLFAEFPGYGVKFISKLQSHCAKMTFAYKSRYTRISKQFTNKRGELAINYVEIFQNSQALSVSVGNSYSED